MARIPDIGNLTDEQTAELAVTCLDALPLHERVKVVVDGWWRRPHALRVDVFVDDDRAELLLWLLPEAEAEPEE